MTNSSTNTESNQPLSALLYAAFPDAINPLVEARLIEDKRGGAVVERQWYVGVGALLADLDRLMSVAATRHAAIFFGVLPRLRRGGKTEDVGPGMVAWVDLDFHDFAGGEAEARERLAAFPLKPTFVVRSGHGLHAYWLVREPTPPAELSALSKRLAAHLGGDHTSDAARLLRLPTTYNRKDPKNPILVEIEVCESERAFNPSEIGEALDLVGVERFAEASTPPPNERTSGAGPTLSPRAKALIHGNQRIRALFEGRGKPEMGLDGRRMDTSSSGYDSSLAVALLKRGLSADEVAAAIWHRPDEAARAKGMDYIRRTVERAKKFVEEVTSTEAEAAAIEADFQVESVELYQSQPPIYHMRIEGVRLELSSGDLLTRGRFAQRFLEGLRRVPALPDGEDWRDLVNGWLASATLVEAPPDGSDEQVLLDSIQHAIENLPVGDERADLDRGKALKLDDGRTAFKARTVFALVREEWPTLKHGKLTNVLKALGFEHHMPKVDGTTVRVWVPSNA
ncbi:MAG: hypothetical protein IT454_23405 [Planctomycetes bacterium]|nr:hypothetical protein [Planctomycetota bacterium]